MPTADRQERIARAYASNMTDEELVADIRDHGHNAIYREALINEFVVRFTDLKLTVTRIQGAHQNYRQALGSRKHGGVAAGALADVLDDVFP